MAIQTAIVIPSVPCFQRPPGPIITLARMPEPTAPSRLAFAGARGATSRSERGWERSGGVDRADGPPRPRADQRRRGFLSRGGARRKPHELITTIRPSARLNRALTPRTTAKARLSRRMKEPADVHHVRKHQ